MKLIVLCLALAAVATAQLQPEHIPIVRQVQDVGVDGTFNYNYETGNGISVSASGAPSGVFNADGQPGTVVQGQFKYVGEDGIPVDVTYIADENGYQPQGAHLPVPPPIPVGIQRALDYIASHPSTTERQQQQFGQQF